MKLHYGDLTDSMCLMKIITETRPSEIYNLAAQSHVKVSVCDHRKLHNARLGLEKKLQMKICFQIWILLRLFLPDSILGLLPVKAFLPG